MSKFSPTASYDLNKYSVKFNKTGVEVYDSPTGKKVDGALYTSGFEIKVIDGSFCFGVISFDKLFKTTVSLKKPTGGFEFQYDGKTALVIGSDELDIPQVTKHIYKINDCPISLKGAETVVVKCPCNDGGSPCSNSCYTKK